MSDGIVSNSRPVSGDELGRSLIKQYRWLKPGKKKKADASQTKDGV
jgi:hypothetical protein